MPYIKVIDKERLNDNNLDVKTVGELNYTLTCTIREYLERQGLSYKTCNDIVGALECCKQEFIRRVVNPYEDTKIKENGDVY